MDSTIYLLQLLIGRLYATQKQIKCYRRALETRHKAGEDLDYAATSFNATKSFQQLDDLDSDLEHYNRFLTIAVKRFTKKHRDVANVLNEIAIIEHEKGNPEKALKLHKESLEIYQIKLGKDHPEARFAHNRLADFHFSRRSYEDSFSEAVTLFKEVLRIEQEVLGKEHKDVVCTLLKLGWIFKEIHDFDRALPYFLEALQIQRNLFNVLRPQAIAITLIEVGHIHLAQDRVSSMMESFSEAERTYPKVFWTSRSYEQSYYLYRFSFSNGAPTA